MVRRVGGEPLRVQLVLLRVQLVLMRATLRLRMAYQVPCGMPLQVALRVLCGMPLRVPFWMRASKTSGPRRVVLRVVYCHARLAFQYATAPDVLRGCSRVTMQSTMCSSWCGPRVLRVFFSKFQAFVSA